MHVKYQSPITAKTLLAHLPESEAITVGAYFYCWHFPAFHREYVVASALPAGALYQPDSPLHVAIHTP